VHTTQSLKRTVALLAMGLMLASCGMAGFPTATTIQVTTTTPATTFPTVTSIPTPTPTTTNPPQTTTTVDPRPLAGRTIVIDPGHNGHNYLHRDEINRLVDIGNGTKACNTTGTSADGYPEALFNWAVAQLVVPLLEDAGAAVLLTRHDNEGWGPCITERAEVGNRAGADAVISIHADGGRPDGRGFHVIHPASIPGLTADIYDESYRLAVALHTAYRATGMPIADYIARNGFSKRSDLGGLNLSKVPAVFLEAGNMRNAEDLALLRSAAFQEKVARSILAALIDFLSG
jgi:N-acetylmuramoyl-L-alanine amidase